MYGILQPASALTIQPGTSDSAALRDVPEDSVLDGSHWFLKMDLIRGTDFLSYVRPVKQLDEQRLRSVLSQLVAAILALHAQHIIHRDLKPSNVMVDEDGRVIVLDFGLVLEQQVGRQASLDFIAGTPRYMAPEQGLGGNVTGAADWYAAGVMLYEALSGRPPHEGKTFEELLRNKSNLAAQPFPPELALPSDLVALCMRLLQREPEQRPNPLEIVGLASSLAVTPTSVGDSTMWMMSGVAQVLRRPQWNARLILRAHSEGQHVGVQLIGHRRPRDGSKDRRNNRPRDLLWQEVRVRKVHRSNLR